MGFIASYYRQLSADIKMKNYTIKTSFFFILYSYINLRPDGYNRHVLSKPNFILLAKRLKQLVALKNVGPFNWNSRLRFCKRAHVFISGL